MIGWLRFQMNDASVWAYFLQTLPISLIAGIIYAVVRFVKRKRKDCPIRLLDETFGCIFMTVFFSDGGMRCRQFSALEVSI